MKNNLIDLHLHLDGSLSVFSVRKLAAINGVKVPDNDEELLKRLQVQKGCRDLNEYLEKFNFPLSLLQTEDAVTFAVENLLKELKKQGIVYSEIRFAPQLHLCKEMSQEDVVKAAVRGLGKAEIDAHLILCCMRGNDNHDANHETVAVAEKFLNQGVCAIDLAGAEGLYPTSDFEDVFKAASEKNIPFTIHAGEAAGADSVWKALEFGAKRIGHGVRSIEDRELLKELAKRHIPLELCPTSNLNTNIFSDISQYPIRRFMEEGVMITVNTDNMTVSNTTLMQEYQLLKETFDLTQTELKMLRENSVKASFAEETLKNELKRKF